MTLPEMPLAFVYEIAYAAAWVLSWAGNIAVAAAISYGIHRLLGNKTPKQGSDPLDRSRFPTAENGICYSILFGTVLKPSYDCCWTGDPKVFRKKRSDVVVYRYYYAGVLFVYCRGPIDGFKQFWYGDAGGGKCAWPTPDDETAFAADGLTSLEFAATNLFGSPYNGGTGSLLGDADLLLGTATQAQNSYLAAQIGANVPAFRGLAAVVGRQINWGCQPYPQILGAVVKRVLIEGADGAERWYVAKAAIDTYDLNIVHVLRECFTDDEWGENRGDDLGTSWEAVADAMYAEGFGISALYKPEPGNLKSFIRQLEEVADLVIYDDPFTGKIEIMALRDDYDVDDLAVITEDEVQVTRMAQPNWRDISALHTINYSDRLHPNNAATTFFHDETVSARQGGRVAPTVYDYRMIHDDELAQAIVTRKGCAETARPWGLELKCKRVCSGFHRGSRFRLNYTDPDVAIASMVVRVEEIDYGSSTDETVRLTVVEDTFKAGYTVLGTPSRVYTAATPDSDSGQVYTIEASEGNAATVNATAPS